MKSSKKLIKVDTSPKPLGYKKLSGDNYQITQTTECLIQYWKHEKYKYTIKQNFETNFRSGPRWLEDLGIPKIGNDEIAVSWLIHDINYAGYISRKEADNLLYYMLLAGDLEEINCQMVFHGLRLFGGFNYSKSPNEKVELEIIHQGVDLEVLDPNEPIFESMEQLPGETPDAAIQFDEQHFETVRKELEALAAKQDKKINVVEIEKYYTKM